MKLLFAFGCFVLAATVVTDRAEGATEKAHSVYVTEIDTQIYDRPDFDAKVIGLAPQNAKLKASVRKYGAFYRVQIDSSRYGYVSEAEVSTDKPTDFESDLSDALSLPRLGLGFEWLNYKEQTRGESLQQGFSAVTIDYTNSFSKFQYSIVPQAPSYYSRYGSTSGFLMFGRAFLLTQFPEGLHFGFGPSLKFSKYRVGDLDLENVNLGLDLEIGFQHKFFRTWGIDAGFQYHFEKTSYPGLQFLITRDLL